jgi:hypothetical protein
VPALLPSELPVRARVRHHWIVMFRRPHLLLLLALVLLFLMAVVAPNKMGWVFVLVLLGFGFLRWQTWQAEWVILTSKRIIRVQGVPETTTSEASLRVDRISGARMIQTVPGKLLGYATIDLEAPGNHPDVRRLERIAHPHAFFLELRRVIFGEPVPPDPDDDPRGYEAEFETEPLPFLPPNERTHRFRP